MGPAINSHRLLDFFFSHLRQVAKKPLKMAFFAPFANFVLLEVLKIGPNKSHGPCDQFPPGLRLLYFHTSDK